MDRLHNSVRAYAWGSISAIPALLGQEPTGEPQAELWMGAHPGDPSLIDRGSGPRSLAEVIAADPEAELGSAVVAKFGPSLPFLLKILAVRTPLSLQVHPSVAQARAGFADEEVRGIPVDAPHRSYRDANHKPELICALDEFEGLCGFRAPAASAGLMASLGVPALEPLIDILRTKPESEALREVLATVLSMSGLAAERTAAEVAAALELAAAGTGRTGAFAGYAFTARKFPGQAGLIAALLLNYVRLRPGEALYLGAGIPHAYLRGTGVEIMANSDNVLRYGLTRKHVDIPGVLRVLDFQSTAPEVLRPDPDANGEQIYRVPVDEFRISRHLLGDQPVQLAGRSPQILLCTDAGVALTAAHGEAVTLSRGQSAYLPASRTPTRMVGPGATVFRATVGR